MGWCHEFGPDINADCGHPMVADAKSCKCTTCGVVCTGRFSGCAAVWAAGPRRVNAVRGATQPRTVPVATVDVAPTDEAEATPAREAATPVDAGRLDALRAEVLTVMRRLDDVQVDSLRTDLASVMHQLEKLTAAVVTQHQELQKLAADRAAPSPAPAPPAAPAPQRMVEQPPPKPTGADRGPEQSKQPPTDRRPQPQPRQARPEQTRPNGGSPTPARTTPTAAPAPGEPEQVDLAVPLDQALVRPVRPGEQGQR